MEPRDAILSPRNTRRLRFHEAPANLKGQTLPRTCQAEETEAPGQVEKKSVCKWPSHCRPLILKT